MGKKKGGKKRNLTGPDATVKTAVELSACGKLNDKGRIILDDVEDQDGDEHDSPRGLVHVTDSAYGPSPTASSSGGSRLGQHRESAATILSTTTRGDSAYEGSVFDASSPLPAPTGGFQQEEGLKKDSNLFASNESLGDKSSKNSAKRGRQKLSKSQQRELEEAAEALASSKKPKAVVDSIFDLNSMAAILYFAHNAMDVLYFKGYSWPNAPKGKNKGKKGGGGGGGGKRK